MIKWHPSKQEVQQVCEQKLAVVISKDYERILIGQTSDILARLECPEYTAINYDETRPFGTFLLNGEYDEVSWTEALLNLYEAQEVFLGPLLGQPIKDLPQTFERKAWTILNNKYKTGDPVCQFVAMRIWHKYWAIRGKKDRKASEEFLQWAQNFVRPFSTQYHIATYPRKVDLKNPVFRRTQSLFTYDKMSLFYYLKNENAECLLVDDSLIPLERFYESKIEKWTKYIIQCKLCGKYFMADSKQYKLCGEACKQEAQKKTRESRKENDGIFKKDKALAAANGYWNSRWTIIRKSPEWSDELVSQYRSAMVKFQEEKRKINKAYQNGEITYSTLLDWLFQQQEEAKRVLQELKEKKE